MTTPALSEDREICENAIATKTIKRKTKKAEKAGEKMKTKGSSHPNLIEDALLMRSNMRKGRRSQQISKQQKAHSSVKLKKIKSLFRKFHDI